MDENGYIINIMGSSKVTFSKYQKQAFVNQVRKRRWVSFIEAMDIISQQLPLFVIFKSKK